jgi:membrane-associated phospholipid phosphatase
MSRNFHILLGVIVLSTLIFSICEARAVKLAVPTSQVVLRVSFPLVALGMAFYYRWRRADKLKNLFLATFWALTLVSLHGVPVYIAARQNVPLRDALLAEIDHRLGLEVPEVLRAIEHCPTLKVALKISYESLLLLMILALILPILCDKPKVVKEYLMAMVISGLISIPLFAAFQAVGPWYYYGYTPDAEQARTMKIFFALKSDEWITVDPANSAGVVAFPSFHTILAVLSAIALWRIKYVRWFAAVLASLIVVSTVTTGWHYLADVLAGLAVTAGSFAAACACFRLEAAMAGLPPWRQRGDPAGS